MKVFKVNYELGNYGSSSYIVAAESETKSILLVREAVKYQYLSDPEDFWRYSPLSCFSAVEVPGIYAKKEGIKSRV